ncbi:unnamed protein product [Ostreobium quekettii]|uniref:Uncharacterized protein n=1 Tax=Ostreobium quekettii TaxID=121088 RepID=A0A8S1JEB9_9CHLO|nr:unnamed protein product [Ostreobium quekettii]
MLFLIPGWQASIRACRVNVWNEVRDETGLSGGGTYMLGGSSDGPWESVLCHKDVGGHCFALELAVLCINSFTRALHVIGLVSPLQMQQESFHVLMVTPRGLERVSAVERADCYVPSGVFVNCSVGGTPVGSHCSSHY